MPHEEPNRTGLPSLGGQVDQNALDQQISIVYQELRRLAASYLRSQPLGHTLQPTALVHEAYLRLVDRSQSDWQSRPHFFRLAAIAMRQILVDHARAKVANKRGGGRIQVEFSEGLNASNERAGDVVALDDALNALVAFDERKALVLELRYFGGLSVEETAETLGVSAATIGRETRYSEGWLRRELQASSRKPGTA